MEAIIIHDTTAVTNMTICFFFLIQLSNVNCQSLIIYSGVSCLLIMVVIILTLSHLQQAILNSSVRSVSKCKVG